MIKIGGTEIADVLIGNTQIYSVWLGGTKMWEKGSAPVSPYDAEVEYLAGTGMQYINTGGNIGTGSFTLGPDLT